jgi:hypothetical protein
MSYAAPKYKRTVRCRYCHKPGHNKSTCPQYAARVEDMREKYGSDYWMVADYDAKKAKRKASGKTRKCSYCSDTGHNRGTCTTLKANMKETKEANIIYRKRVFQKLVHHGAFTGALITNGTQRGGTDWPDGESTFKLPMVITRVCWENINVWETEFRYFSNNIRERPPYEIKPLHALRRAYPIYANFPYDYDLNHKKMDRAMFNNYDREKGGNDWYSQYRDSYFITITSKVPAEAPPIGWLNCEDEAFKKTLKEFYKAQTKGHQSPRPFTGVPYEPETP